MQNPVQGVETALELGCNGVAWIAGWHGGTWHGVWCSCRCLPRCEKVEGGEWGHGQNAHTGVQVGRWRYLRCGSIVVRCFVACGIARSWVGSRFRCERPAAHAAIMSTTEGQRGASKAPSDTSDVPLGERGGGMGCRKWKGMRHSALSMEVGSVQC